MSSYGVPNNPGSDIVVFMAENIADPGDISPRDLGIFGLDLIGYVA
jgi:hypothetical protein